MDWNIDDPCKDDSSVRTGCVVCNDDSKSFCEESRILITSCKKEQTMFVQCDDACMYVCMEYCSKRMEALHF